MAKKKTADELKLMAVKIERDLIPRAKMIAADRGMSLAGYLSELVRSGMAKDWSKMIRREGGDE